MSAVKVLSLLVLGVLVGGFGPSPAAWAGRCNQTTVISDTSGGPVTYGDLSDRPARVCSVEFFANGSNGVGVVFDSPSDVDTHAQTKVVAEPGAATAGNSEGRYYGEEGIPTQHGLDAVVNSGTLIIRWAGASP